jgi:VIT1/CCC1 family predicted Fe2+/Mn2+ transporter
MAHLNKEYSRSIIFGIEDSLVSTTGLIVGLSVGTSDKKIVILGGLVAIAIEALSMGAGEYLSDDAVNEADKNKDSEEKPVISGILMFVSYLLAGMVPVAPVLLLGEDNYIYFTIGFALIGLFILGYLKGRLLKTRPLKGAFKILVVGGIATLLGVIVGYIFKI